MCVGVDSPVENVIRRIDDNRMGVAFVIDADLRLVGSVTDGDIRRALLGGRLDLAMPVSTVMNEHPSVLPMGSGAEAAYAALSAGLREGKSVFPRVDDAGRIQSFSYREDWGLVPIAEPSLTGNEAGYVLECLESNWISSTGPFVARFETAFSEYTGLAHPVAVSNGTTAITLALQALRLPPGAEVIVPDSTFAATANAVVAAGGRPVLADVDPQTWGLSAESVRDLIGPETWGIVPVHLYGNPCDVEGLRALCDEHGLVMVEDCAEAIGTTASGRHVGALAEAACFSFFGNKTLTTGEGGMTFFRQAEAEEHARVLRDHGMSKSRRYWHDVIGYNYRMTNLQAAIGLAQSERATELVGSKLSNAKTYVEGLAAIGGVSPMPQSPFGDCSYWLMPVMIEAASDSDRDALMESLAARGIQTRATFPPLHRMPAFADCRGASAFPVASEIADRGVCLPNNPGMSADDISVIIATLDEAAPRRRDDRAKARP
ncbi:MAG: aminotransferase class I/II-fold pyridoxal phosphate-dependent enzyme [Actinomycetota bacterium]|nr:aminotransferase class I/II-fold pyridoxal phosphate-dependent enzyme [Actinomycetota bacterium]